MTVARNRTAKVRPQVAAVGDAAILARVLDAAGVKVRGAWPSEANTGRARNGGVRRFLSKGRFNTRAEYVSGRPTGRVIVQIVVDGEAHELVAHQFVEAVRSVPHAEAVVLAVPQVKRILKKSPVPDTRPHAHFGLVGAASVPDGVTLRGPDPRRDEERFAALAREREALEQSATLPAEQAQRLAWLKEVLGPVASIRFAD